MNCYAVADQRLARRVWRSGDPPSTESADASTPCEAHGTRQQEVKS